jgi:hypothetical protein
VVRQVKFAHDNEILVFPSVTNNFVYIQSGKEMRAELYNISGVRLETVLIRGTSNFDMSKYPTGVYFIRVVSEYKTFKIIKH